ncbi:MAG: hypothetical protein DWQ31_06220 [Planctomycetota bacterium]|nr:MAG: hypothetical protein DWQ31_06220 [Planctomycetota bacterium]REJ98603.1 MAG: hypothetical protein DWQ35_00975 [Planctomycetota bacterium]REK29903.1 MAG: hypothetical protein DWQ42_03095 [Planctomycetota bacterium]REK47927.1 MAG: hypothetical protein DWQ46_03265 [Planctomycetota bacterium]
MSSRPSTLALLLRRLISPAGQGGAVFTLVVIIVVLAGAGVWVWKRLGPQIYQTDQYRLVPDQIVVSEPPRWLTAADVRDEVVRKASLDRPLSILDDDLSRRIGLAFEAHPWVAEVIRVEKFYPARVEVQVRYRQPVATIALGARLLPLDIDGVRLPEENFSQVELRKMPRIRGLMPRATPRAGGNWNDPRILGAVRIAEAFGDAWHEMGLRDILPSRTPVAGQSNVYSFELATIRGRRIPWGPQALVDTPDEPLAAEKFEKLRTYFEQYGSLDAKDSTASETPEERTAELEKDPVQ